MQPQPQHAATDSAQGLSAACGTQVSGATKTTTSQAGNTMSSAEEPKAADDQQDSGDDASKPGTRWGLHSVQLPVYKACPGSNRSMAGRGVHGTTMTRSEQAMRGVPGSWVHEWGWGGMGRTGRNNNHERDENEQTGGVEQPRHTASRRGRPKAQVHKQVSGTDGGEASRALQRRQSTLMGGREDYAPDAMASPGEIMLYGQQLPAIPGVALDMPLWHQPAPESVQAVMSRLDSRYRSFARG
jgi:hypothetical protein